MLVTYSKVPNKRTYTISNFETSQLTSSGLQWPPTASKDLKISFYNWTRVFLSVNCTCTFILYFKVLPKYVGNHYRKNVNGRKITTIVSLFQRIFRLSNDLKGYLHSIKKFLKKLLKEKFFCCPWFRKWFLAKLRLCDEWSEFWH